MDETLEMGINTRFTAQEHLEICRVAKADDRTPSQWIRSIVRAELRTRKAKKANNGRS